MSPMPPRGAFHRFGFPRVSGDEPAWPGIKKLANLFSPRERG